MSTSFHVNQHDLDFILKQIKIAEAHAAGKTTIQAIQEVYDVSAQDAALMPAGLRTVDGTDNTLLAGQQTTGASGTRFPRLTDPVYSNEQDGDSIPISGPTAPPLTNTNYTPGATTAGNVVDADPRTISNLIVDQTAGNPAAITAALKALGITGDDANAATDAISSAYKATLTAASNNATTSAAVVTAQKNLLSATSAQQAASVPDAAADAKVATLTTAVTEATEAASAARAAQTAVNALVSALASSPPAADAASLFATAKAAAATALTEASAVVTALGNSATPGAINTMEGAQALLTALEALDGSDNTNPIDAADHAPASAAATAYRPVSQTGGTADASVQSLTQARTAAVTDAAQTQATLDQATTNLGAAQTAYDNAVAAAGTAGGGLQQTQAFLDSLMDEYGLDVGPEGGIRIENISPDVGLSPKFNNLFTIFGQFFDHGLDLVKKGGAGTVYIPLENDDPLIAGADKVFGTADDLPAQLRFMALTRATPDGTSHTNMTTSWIDQNQTYTSHASHQVFLREQVRMNVDADGNGTLDGAKAYSTGRLLDGTLPGTMGTWADVKAQALAVLGIRLTDHDIHRVPLLATDQYGNLKLGPNGYAQMVMAPDATHAANWLKEGTAAGLTTAGSVAAGPAFLDDIAHHAVPGRYDSNGDRRITDADAFQTADTLAGVADDGNPATYDDELLNSHFITGDGRGNENIGLSAVHAVFHAEHNRIFEENKHTILESKNLAFINEWLLKDITALPTTQAQIDALAWDGARMFQAARFSTEMQYQHMVFEEFGRRIQPAVDPFVFTNTPDIDPSIVAEFAHAVYRFGHSMLTDTVDRIDNNLNPITEADGQQLSLIEAFLNPQAYTGTAASFEQIQGAILRGLGADVGSEIDEFIVPALRSNLLGLPLDLAALNIARARETGVPTLNQTRDQLYNDFGVADLKPYESWTELAQNLKNPISLINLVAAYGTHDTITSVKSLEAKRDAATLLVLGNTDINGDGVEDVAPEDRLAFLRAEGAYASSASAANGRGGLNAVDLWVGGLAEKVNEFGGMLGSTFNFIFEYQMEQLQAGDRFYYLSRTQGLNLIDALEQNTFADIMMRNSSMGDKYAPHIFANSFLTPDMILELDRGIAQHDYNGTGTTGLDPIWDDALLQKIDPKVVRGYTGATTVTEGGKTHDVGGSLTFRGGEHVVLGGTEGADTLRSDIGDDAVWGDGGNDYINSGQGADQVFGGDGDDIIEDPFGDNFLRGERGNDVVTTARGINFLFGGQGHDALFLGQDASETFGGEGNDFILGGSGGDFLQGNEGDDWIEGGEGFDTIAGENSELFFNSTIIGHDVAWGQGNEQDYDLESGDDIAFSGASVQRFEGMFGFDWAIGKYDVAGVNWDATIPIFTSVPAEILRDRFDLMEGFSGWKLNDTIRGDDRGTAGVVDPDETFNDHVLTSAGLDRIEGMKAWFGNARATLAALNPEGYAGAANADTMYRDGNMLLGGGGSDVLQGRGGFDILDGDAWLNVRIKIVKNGVTYSAESLNSSTVAGGPNAGKVYFTDANGTPDFARVAFSGQSLTALLLNRTFNPGDMSIHRELEVDTAAGAVDTAVFQGSGFEYEIEGRGTQVVTGTRTEIKSAWDVNGDGFISVTDTLATRAGLVDDVDLIKNIERLQFADETIDITQPLSVTLNARILFNPTTANPSSTLLPGAGPLGQIIADVDQGTFREAADPSNIFTLAADGTLSLTRAMASGQNYNLFLELAAGGGTQTETLRFWAGTSAAETTGSSADDDIVYANAGDDIVTGGDGQDRLYGQAGNDTISGGNNADLIAGGSGADRIDGGAGGDLIHFGVADGTDALVDGGADLDTLRVVGTTAGNTVAVTLGATGITALSGITSIVNVETITMDLGAGADRLTYNTTTAAVAVDLTDGTTTGLGSFAGIEHVSTSNGNDSLRGDMLANSLLGLGGNDVFYGTDDEAADVYNGGTGVDTVDYSASTRNLTANVSLATAPVGGSGAAQDSLVAIENIIGGIGDDSFTGGTAANTFTGGAGRDNLVGAGGNDVLDGGVGGDRIHGGGNTDRMTGGADGDVFVFSAITDSSTATSDTITDFASLASGGAAGTTDKIDLQFLAAQFIGSAGFGANATNQIRVTTNAAGNTLVQVDNDLDTAAEMTIIVQGRVGFTVDDFLL